ncbi:MAG: DUF2271 domain-containing protein [Devosia sp.]
MKTTILLTLALAAVPSLALATPVGLEVEMGSYMGEEAFFVVYVIDSEGRYAKTLWVAGRDRAYYKEMARWWKYLARQPQDLDAITGASVGSDEGVTLAFEIDEAMLNAGYSLRIESAVEELTVFAEDAVIPLSDASRGQTIEGSGYIDFVILNY